MPEWMVTILLGVVEGVTEFLPISSTGHLLLCQAFFGVEKSELFNVGIQAGAVLAVVLIYWKRMVGLVVNWRKPEQFDYLCKCGAAFAVTVVFGLLARKLGFNLEDSNLVAVAAAVIGGAVLIFWAEWRLKGKTGEESITWPVALVMGMAQVLAGVFPGTSRSAATIMIAMVMGTNRMAATEFSFLLGIPTMFAASGYLFVGQIRESGWPSREESLDFLLGFVVSMVVAFVVVKWLLHFLRTHTFTPFAWYRLGLGLVLVAWLLMGESAG